MYKTRILLITKASFFDVDRVGASVVLAKLLARKYETIVDCYFNVDVPKQDLARIVAPKDINFIEKLDASYFTISLERGNAKVKEVKWEETGDKIKLLVFTEKGEVDPTNYILDPGNPHYDLVYSVGIKTEEDILQTLGTFSSIWQTAETFNVDIRVENSKFAQTNHILTDSKSFGEAISALADELGVVLTADEATELLACIYWKTNSLRNKYTGSSSLSAVQSLVSKGGSISSAAHKIFSSLSLIEFKARQEAYNSLVLNSDKIAFAKVTTSTAKQLSNVDPIHPVKNPLSDLRDTLASFVLVPIDEAHTLVLASSTSAKVGLKKLFGSYGYVGDEMQSEMMFELNTEAAEQKIKQILDRKVFNRGNSLVVPGDKDNPAVEPKGKLDTKEIIKPSNDKTVPDVRQASQLTTKETSQLDNQSTSKLKSQPTAKQTNKLSTPDPGDKLEDAEPLPLEAEKQEKLTAKTRQLVNQSTSQLKSQPTSQVANKPGAKETSQLANSPTNQLPTNPPPVPDVRQVNQPANSLTNQPTSQLTPDPLSPATEQIVPKKSGEDEQIENKPFGFGDMGMIGGGAVSKDPLPSAT